MTCPHKTAGYSERVQWGIMAPERDHMGIYLGSFVVVFAIIVGTFVTSCVIERIARAILRTNSQKSRIWAFTNRWPLAVMGIAAILGFALMVPMPKLVYESTIIEGRHVTAQQTVIYGPCKDLPEGATDVNFFTSYFGTTADFSVNETDFVKWCRSHDLNFEEIRETSPYSIYPAGGIGSHDVCITNGLFGGRPYTSSNGSGTNVAFDRQNQRAYYNYSSH